MNTKLSITLIASLILGLSSASTPAQAESPMRGPKLTAVHLAKMKAMYLPARTLDQKALFGIR